MRIPSTQSIKENAKETGHQKQNGKEQAEHPEHPKPQKKDGHKKTAKKSPYPLDKSQQRCYTKPINR